MRFRGANVLTPADVGRRVTVRRRLPDGKATDVLGILTEMDATSLTVRRHDGSVAKIPLETIIASRVVLR